MVNLVLDIERINICENCGIDMGEGYIHCGAAEDGVCPECGWSQPINEESYELSI